MKKDFVRFIMVIVLILFVAYFIYPTPWHYSMYQGKYPVKINWITGKTYVMYNYEWKELKVKVDYSGKYNRENIIKGM